MHGRIHCNLAPEIVLRGASRRVRYTVCGTRLRLEIFGCYRHRVKQPTSNLFSFIDPGAASASSLVSPCTAAQAPSPFD